MVNVTPSDGQTDTPPGIPWVLNATDLEDEDLSTQRSHQVWTEGQGEQVTVVGDK